MTNDTSTIAASPEMIAALRIGLHYALQSASFARSMKVVAEINGMHGSAAAHESSARDAEQAAEVIRALLAKID